MYELVFWKYEDEVYLNHHLVYEALIEGEFVQVVQEIPVEVIVNRIQNVFADWEKVDATSWKNTQGKGAFEVATNQQCVMIDCYGTEGTTMDVLVEILSEFKCALYDPQVPARYDDVEE